MRPSTPAVRRPALTSVTRRTLTSALLRERSISFCRLRTFFRSPACDAAKIRCRSRRTFSSAWPQSTRSQSKRSPSGPFAPAAAAVAVAPALAVIASNLPFGSGVAACLAPQAHQTRVSALSGQDTRCPYPASYAGTAGGGPARGTRFPAAFRPPAFASRVFLCPLGDSAFLTSGLPAARSRRTPSGLPRSAWSRCGRGGRRLNPGDSGAHPTGRWRPVGTCRLTAAGPCSPAPATRLREST